MGFGLKRTFKKIAKNPLTLVNPVWGASDTIMGGKIGGLGAKPGPPNPFAPPDITSYLNKPAVENPYLKGMVGPVGESEFGDLVKNINAPSSVDAVRREVEGERLQSLLTGIDEDVARNVGNVKLDAEEMGFSGPGTGTASTLAALATSRTGGARAKADARLSGMGAELDRVKAREEALRGAYGDRYKTNAAAGLDLKKLQAMLAQQGIQAGSDRETELLKIMADLYSGGESRKQAGKKNSIVEDMLRNVNIGIGFGG